MRDVCHYCGGVGLHDGWHANWGYQHTTDIFICICCGAEWTDREGERWVGVRVPEELEIEGTDWVPFGSLMIREDEVGL